MMSVCTSANHALIVLFVSKRNKNIASFAGGCSINMACLEKMREREKQKRGRLLKFRTMCTSFICAHFWMKDEYTQRSGLQCPNFVVIHTADHAAIVRYTTEISAKRHSQPCRQPSASAMRTNKAHISCTVSGSWVGGWEGVGEEGAREGK